MRTSYDFDLGYIPEDTGSHLLDFDESCLDEPFFLTMPDVGLLQPSGNIWE
jgi:hypothetical protein